ncbi:MAG: hypothetical protein H7A21_01030 [Spirochaetales bacterium]|nr:hypothetical protein [Leptospiraceae bacterium]MCP5479991.1 hypothetical protein [Spirochaetales bacterium]MCP5486621.1 hypothetical protein [Spirochaetales bacterium]
MTEPRNVLPKWARSALLAGLVLCLSGCAPEKDLCDQGLEGPSEEDVIFFCALGSGNNSQSLRDLCLLQLLLRQQCLDENDGYYLISPI